MVKKFNSIQTINNVDLVKKAEYNTKIKEFWKKVTNYDQHFTANQFNKLTKEKLAEKLKKS